MASIQKQKPTLKKGISERGKTMKDIWRRREKKRIRTCGEEGRLEVVRVGCKVWNLLSVRKKVLDGILEPALRKRERKN